MAADASPFPREERTPPVTKMNLALKGIGAVPFVMVDCVSPDSPRLGACRATRFAPTPESMPVRPREGICMASGPNTRCPIAQMPWGVNHRGLRGKDRPCPWLGPPHYPLILLIPSPRSFPRERGRCGKSEFVPGLGIHRGRNSRERQYQSVRFFSDTKIQSIKNRPTDLENSNSCYR